MTDKELKEKIIAEIERRIIAIPDNNDGVMARRTDKIEYQLLNDLLYFVNSLPDEPTFKMCVESADKHPKKGLVDIEKACKWLKLHAVVYLNKCNNPTYMEGYFIDTENLLHDFRKAMKE